MFVLFVDFVADEGLRHGVELVRWLLISFLVVVTPEVVSMLNLVRLLEHFLMDQLACQRVPEGHHVEPIDCGHYVVLLLPNNEVIFHYSHLL